MNREDLAWDIHELLQFPKPEHFNIRASKAYKIVGHIVRTMIEALERGEEIRISGFGVFRLITQPARRRNHGYFHNLKFIQNEIKTHKARKVVHFKPSKVLKRFINES